MLLPLPMQSQFLTMATTARPQSPSEAANKIASIYESYASLGMAGGAFPLIAPGPGRAAMATPLAAAFSIKPGVPATVAQALGAMVVAYWSGATFATPAPGVAAPPVAVPALIAGVTALLAVPNNPAPVFASQLALLLDACTRTVLVTFALPPFTLPVV